MPIMQAVISRISRTMPNGIELSRFRNRSMSETVAPVFAALDFAAPAFFCSAGVTATSSAITELLMSVSCESPRPAELEMDDCADAIAYPYNKAQKPTQ